MRTLRLFLALLAFSMVASLVATQGDAALAQTSSDAADEANEARQRAGTASGLVDEALADRDEIERQLADSITRLNELTAQLSEVGADVDRIAAQVGYADVELAGIQADLEIQAVDAYMTVVASPSVSLVNSGTVERAMVASSVVEDVVADGRLSVSQLLTKRQDLESLKETFLEEQERYAELQTAVDAEVANYVSLYEQADAEVASAIRVADQADREYRAALGAVEVARAKEAERQRQESRNPTTTTTTPPPSTPGTSGPTTTTTAPATTSTSGGGGGGGPWNHPPAVEQWRSLVQQFFPSSRVEEALVIINCESNGDSNAVNPYSGAAGLFQFLPSTWASTAPKAGYPDASPLDPEANTASAAWLANRYHQLGYDYWHAWNCRRMLG
ncbi:MAG TPA: transglycosylase SLT domain-containing protein [Acidimicrobiia bacterium]|nr:transglycosylase SLT domain-containing protein [Acidimicrobiia bacterium]